MLGFNAFNITHPCKQLVLEHLDEVSDEARAIGAVNTVVIQDGKFHRLQHRRLRFRLGPGQRPARCRAGRGAAAGRRRRRLRRRLRAARRRGQGADSGGPRGRPRRRTRRDPGHAIPRPRPSWPAPRTTVPDLLPRADGVLNATPVGMHHHPGLPLDSPACTPEHWVADVVYRPVDTELIRAAQALGCRTLDGGHMAVGQAVDAFSHHHRRSPRTPPACAPTCSNMAGGGTLMRTSIATVCLSGTLEEKMLACAKAGFDGIEIFEQDLIVSAMSPEEVRALADRLGPDPGPLPALPRLRGRRRGPLAGKPAPAPRPSSGS